MTSNKATLIDKVMLMLPLTLLGFLWPRAEFWRKGNDMIIGGWLHVPVAWIELVAGTHFYFYGSGASSKFLLFVMLHEFANRRKVSLLVFLTASTCARTHENIAVVHSRTHARTHKKSELMHTKHAAEHTSTHTHTHTTDDRRRHGEEQLALLACDI